MQPTRPVYPLGHPAARNAIEPATLVVGSPTNGTSHVTGLIAGWVDAAMLEAPQFYVRDRVDDASALSDTVLFEDDDDWGVV